MGIVAAISAAAGSVVVDEAVKGAAAAAMATAGVDTVAEAAAEHAMSNNI